MKLLIFDTETTGLPKTREGAYKGPNNWPHIVSISWILLEDLNVIDTQSFIVKPKWNIPEDSVKIHGITNEIALNKGDELEEVMDKFFSINYDWIIAHNLDFDLNVLRNAMLWDLKKPVPSIGKQMCTMNLSRNWMKIPFGNGRYGYKSPKLSELYEYVMKKKPDESKLHGSLYDTTLLCEIIQNNERFKIILGLLDKPISKSNEGSKKRKYFEI
jgi:DNA polymerase III epsilon subunit-like protein